jgi:hypothetical protein
MTKDRYSWYFNKATGFNIVGYKGEFFGNNLRSAVYIRAEINTGKAEPLDFNQGKLDKEGFKFEGYLK